MIKSFSRRPHEDRKPFKLRCNGPSGSDMERAARIRETMEALFEANKEFPVIVEGKKDAAALRELGLVGEIVTLHRGTSLYEFCEGILEHCDKVILLSDWDTKGESLNRSLQDNLRGHWEELSGFRELLKILCQKDVKDIEGIPKLLRKLEGHEAPRD